VAEPRDECTADPTEDARRSARYTYAQRRIQKIVDGMPPLTDEQLSRLAVLLRPGEQAGE
jgi:hypothetical protein